MAHFIRAFYAIFSMFMVAMNMSRFSCTFLIFLSISSLEASSFSSPLDLWEQAYGDPAPKVHIYKNQDHQYIQEVNFSLRAQYQGAYVHSNQGEYEGSHHSTSEWRRFRLGGNIKFLDHFTLNNVWNIGGLESAGYRRNEIWHDHGTTKGTLYDLSLKLNYQDDFSILAGKHYPGFFAENRLSSADYRLPEVPGLESQLSANSGFGLNIANNTAKRDFGWQFGVWSNTEERSRGTWGTWQSAYFVSGISYKADKILLEKGRIHADWIHSTQDMKKMATSQFRDTHTGPDAKDIFAIYYRGTEGPAELVLEGIWGHNLASYRRNNAVIHPDNVFGFSITPLYMLTDHIQMGWRYQWSKGCDAVRLGSRYASLVQSDGAYVDEKHAIGMGFNFFPYSANQKRLKIMTFVEYSNTNKRHGTGGFTGWSFIAGVYTDF